MVKKEHYELDALLKGKGVAPCFLVLETIQDPGNLGTIMRTAEGAGVGRLTAEGVGRLAAGAGVGRLTAAGVGRLAAGVGRLIAGRAAVLVDVF